MSGLPLLKSVIKQQNPQQPPDGPVQDHLGGRVCGGKDEKEADAILEKPQMPPLWGASEDQELVTMSS